MTKINSILTEEQVQQSQQVKVAATATVSEEDLLTDEYLTLYKTCKELGVQEMTARMDEIKKRLQSIANEQVAPDQIPVFSTALGEIEFSKCSNTREVADKKGLLDHLSDKFDQTTVVSVIKIGITELGKVLSEKEMEPFVKVKPGSRSLKEVRLA